MSDCAIIGIHGIGNFAVAVESSNILKYNSIYDPYMKMYIKLSFSLVIPMRILQAMAKVLKWLASTCQVK